MIANRKFGIGALLAAMLLMSMVFVPAVNAADNAAKENQDDTSVGEPWFEKGDELNRLSIDELRALAEQNETVRKMIEEDLKIKPAQIESLKDLENLPDNYPEDIRKAEIENFTSKNINQQFSTKATTTNTVDVWIVADEEYRSTFGSNWQTQAYNTIENADNAFYNDHNINFVVGKYSTWDSDDSTDNSSLLLAEAQSETGWNSNHQGMDMLAIFTNQAMDHRGRSESMNYNGGDAWIMKHQITSGWDWHLAQHEA
ncbi:hypothetical protein GX865_05240, partial [Candidatus Saccharibacteria bacterium]|nr:hypothetical protein [Candidatus Saccharibacteria bacterium]